MFLEWHSGFFWNWSYFRGKINNQNKQIRRYQFLWHIFPRLPSVSNILRCCHIDSMQARTAWLWIRPGLWRPPSLQTYQVWLHACIYQSEVRCNTFWRNFISWFYECFQCKMVFEVLIFQFHSDGDIRLSLTKKQLLFLLQHCALKQFWQAGIKLPLQWAPW